MAQLKSTVVSGSLRVTDSTYTSTLQTQILHVPTASNGTSYGAGTDGQILRTNGASAYWGDAPASGVTSITLTSGAGITVSNSGTAITSTGSRTISITGVDTSSGSESQCLTKKGTWKNFTANAGTVTSVQVQASSPLQSSTSTAQNTSLNTTISFSNQNANLILAGPSTGSAAAPTFRALVAADIPALAYVPATSGTKDVNTLVNTGIYNITSGQATNAPKGYGYGQLLVMSYRKHTGNTTTDWASQIYLHNGNGTETGNATGPGNVLYYRTSNSSSSNSWFSWQKAVHTAAAYTKVGNTNQPVYIAEDGSATAITAIGAAYGGTGTTTAPTQGGVIYASSNSAYASTGAGTAGQVLISGGSNAPTWHGGFTLTGSAAASYVASFAGTTAATSTTTGAVKIAGGLGVAGNIYGANVYGAVWNDYAEYRQAQDQVRPGNVVIDTDWGTLRLSTKRLQPGAQVVSDTFGFAIGKTDECETPLAVSGRVLAYTYQPRENYHAGMAVCSAPNGTIDIMTREEIQKYPDAIIGIVSEIPNYESWGTGNVPINGRIWIKVR